MKVLAKRESGCLTGITSERRKETIVMTTATVTTAQRQLRIVIAACLGGWLLAVGAFVVLLVALGPEHGPGLIVALVSGTIAVTGGSVSAIIAARNAGRAR
jgi:hypothetical protein